MILRLICMLAFLFAATACDGPASEKLIPKPKFKKKVFKGDVKGQEFFTPQVDILFVVDDSGSMDTHQNNLANGVQRFVDNLDGNSLLEYHFGVITSSKDFSSSRSSGGGYLAGHPAFIDKNTQDGLQKLKDNLMVGTNGDASEIFLDVVQMAFSSSLGSPGGRNNGFMRKNAYLAVIFITDSDDQGTLGPQGLHKFLVDMKGGKEDLVLAYGAIIPPNDSCNRSGEPEPYRIMEFLDLAKGGDFFSLCDLDFGKRLAELANDIVGRVGKYFYLREAPVPETIQVKYGNQSIPNDPLTGWTYDPTRNAIYFGPELEFRDDDPDAKLSVNFVTGTFEVDQPQK